MVSIDIFVFSLEFLLLIYFFFVGGPSGSGRENVVFHLNLKNLNLTPMATNVIRATNLDI